MSSGKGGPGGATGASSDERRLCSTDVGEHSDELLNQSLDSVVQSSLSGATIAPLSS